MFDLLIALALGFGPWLFVWMMIQADKKPAPKNNSGSGNFLTNLIMLDWMFGDDDHDLF